MSYQQHQASEECLELAENSKKYQRWLSIGTSVSVSFNAGLLIILACAIIVDYQSSALYQQVIVYAAVILTLAPAMVFAIIGQLILKRLQ